jgi:cysteine-rich repeat protein
VTGTESCDDGNQTDGDGCDSNCTITVCGNGIPTGAESCDDGNSTNGDGCDSNCTITACGNGIRTGGEACDDGNSTGGDGCSPGCALEVCGNGIVDVGEACDPGPAGELPTCNRDCTIRVCGDGKVNVAAGEQCDDGNLVDTDNCLNQCVDNRCGDGVLDNQPPVVEACDDGNQSNNDGCNIGCTLPSCGNGIVDQYEQCDDGNQAPLDGCSATCKLENHETEPNDDGSVATGTDDFSAANANGPFNGSVVRFGSLTPAGDEDVFRFNNPSSSAVVVRFQVWDQSAGMNAPCNADPTLTIRDVTGTPVAYNDDGGPGFCVRLDFSIPAGGSVYAQIAEFQDNNVIPGYILQVTYLPVL